MLSLRVSKPKLWIFFFVFVKKKKRNYIPTIDLWDSCQSTASPLEPKASTDHERQWWNFVLCIPFFFSFTRHWAMAAIHRGSQMQTKCTIQTLQVVISLLRSSMECPHWEGTVGCNPKDKRTLLFTGPGTSCVTAWASRNSFYSGQNNLSRIVVYYTIFSSR